MSKFLSSKLIDLKHYTAGEQPTDTQYIKLNTNESPYPPSDGVLEALRGGAAQKLNLYPNPDASRLVDKIAGMYGVLPENVIIGNGSDELLAFSFQAFFDTGVVFPDITYGFYPVYANLYAVPYTQVPLNDDLTVNPDDYIGVGKNVVIANPNAPTGIDLELERIEAIVKSNQDNLVLIDEAYVDFGSVSVMPLVKKYDNLLVIHTYSKARSMAGARLAYAIASKPVIDDLRKIKYSFNPYNINSLTQAAGLAALLDDEYYREKQREIIETRGYASRRLSELGFEMTDSKANFLFAKTLAIPGEQLYLTLKEKGILVRHWNLPRISDFVRITIGTKAQMDTLCDTIKEILEIKSGKCLQ